ncbi:MAG: O-antigen ligase family protein [Ktedonobacterales bacterium]|nr:O-antigen ligase family protein [Ktedonobacterales bacterium]
MIRSREVLRTRWPRREALTIAGLILGLVAFYLAPAPLLALPGLLLFAALAWRRLAWALCLLPLTFPFWYVPRPFFGHAVFPLSESALGVCLVIALAHALRKTPLLATLLYGQRLHGQRRQKTAPPATPRSASLPAPEAGGVGARSASLLRQGVERGGWVVASLGPWLVLGAGLLLLGGLLGVLVARRPHEALRAFRWEVVEPLVYLALVAAYVRGREAARLLAWAFLASAVLVAALAYAQVLWLHVTFTPLEQGSRLVRYAAAGRATGIIYGSGNSLGAWLERALPLALALALAARGLGKRERLVALGCALFYLPPLVWSASRGAQVGAAVACALVLVASVGLVRLAAALAALAVAVALVLRATLTRAFLQGHNGTGQARLLVWLAALHMIRDHPLLGIGPDQFQYYYSARYTSQPYWITRINGRPTTLALDPTLAHPHNLPLDLWLSVGLVGLAGFALALGNFWLRCARLWRAGAGRAGRWPAALALGAGASVLAGVTHGLVDSAYFVPDLALAFWWAVALLLILERGA